MTHDDLERTSRVQATTRPACYLVSMVACFAAVALNVLVVILRVSLPPPRNTGDFFALIVMAFAILGSLGTAMVISLLCAMIAIVKGNRRGILLVAANVAMVGWLTCLGNGYGPSPRLRTGEHVDFVTFNVGLPAGAKIVATKQDFGFAQDSRWYLIFDAPEQGIGEFAKAYSNGVTIDKYLKTRFELRGAGPSGTWKDSVDGMPWDLTTIESGRYFQRNDTGGFVAIDVAKNRVYVFR